MFCRLFGFVPKFLRQFTSQLFQAFSGPHFGLLELRVNEGHFPSISAFSILPQFVCPLNNRVNGFSHTVENFLWGLRFLGQSQKV